MTTPRLSVCIPTYRRAPYLRECLDSIIASIGDRWDQVEIVISDNASPDDTPSVAAEYQRRHPQIRYNRNRENVADKNFYIASQLAAGEYVWIFCDDDKMTPQAIPAALDCLRQNPDLVIVNYAAWSRDFTSVKTPRALPVKTSQAYRTADAVLAGFGPHLAYLPSVILRKPLAYPLDYAVYEPHHNFAFMYAAYAALPRQCWAVYLSDPLVCNRADNSAMSREQWDQIFLADMAHTLESLQDRGYALSAVRAAKHRLLRDFALGVFVFRISRGLPVRHLYKQMQPHYGRNIFFWTAIVPALFTPRPIAQLAGRLVKLRRRLST